MKVIKEMSRPVTLRCVEYISKETGKPARFIRCSLPVECFGTTIEVNLEPSDLLGRKILSAIVGGEENETEKAH